MSCKKIITTVLCALILASNNVYTVKYGICALVATIATSCGKSLGAPNINRTLLLADLKAGPTNNSACSIYNEEITILPANNLIFKAEYNHNDLICLIIAMSLVFFYYK